MRQGKFSGTYHPCKSGLRLILLTELFRGWDLRHSSSNFSPEAESSSMDTALKRKVFLRSLMLQAGWNFERMQNIGFAFALYPVLKKNWKAPQALKRAVTRHMAAFNTQPYMSSFVLGLVWRLEEQMAAKQSHVQSGGAAEESADEHQVHAIKKTASSALAAIGDSLFWGALRPATLEICLIIWLVFGFYGWIVPIAGREVVETRGSVPAIFIGLLAGLLVYNGFTLWVRWRGLDFGYGRGQKNSINCGLDAVNWQKIVRILKVFCFAAAIMIIVGGLSLFFEEKGDYPLSLITPLIVFVFAWIIKKLKFTNVSACGIMFLAWVVFLYLRKFIA